MVLRNSLLWLVVFGLLFTGSASAASSADESGWEFIAPGIDYRLFQLPDPNNVFVTRMDRNNFGVTLESSLAQGKLSEGRETVSGMYYRYDQAINYWGGSEDPPVWGMRNQVIVAINGSYFDMSNGVPQGGFVQSGWYAKRYDNLGGWGGFAWKLNRSLFISECVTHFPENQFITYPATGDPPNTQLVDFINQPRGADDLVIFTPQYNSQTGTDDSGVEVLVEMTRPTMILPGPASASGIVRQIRNGAGNSLIPFNSIVLSASGTAAETLLENVQVGSEIQLSQEITSFEYDCVMPYDLSWSKTYTSIQGAYFFLKNGQIREFGDTGAIKRHPRTAIAYNDQYIYFIVVDGRDVYHSIGMSINELALFTRDTLGAISGVAQDGGGSSTMVINGQVVNNTFCNIYTCMGYKTYYLPVVPRNSSRGKYVPAAEGNIVVSAAGIERAVANGMLMVIAQPAVYSAAFTPGDPVITLSDTELRLGPGTNYSGITIIQKDSQGTILPQMNGLDGVMAKSTYWWYVDFGGLTGWVPEGELASQAR